MLKRHRQVDGSSSQDAEFALLFAYLAEATYQDHPTVNERIARVGLRYAHRVSNDSFFGNSKLTSNVFSADVIRTDHGTTIIAVRGTFINQRRGLLTNLVLADLSGRFSSIDAHVQTRVHHGFLKVMEALWDTGSPDPLAELLSDAVRRGERIYITGHSLGGAVAYLVAYRAMRDIPGFLSNLAGVLTFGAPRPGDESFHAAYADSGLETVTTRYVAGLDIVPHLAPRWRETPALLETYAAARDGLVSGLTGTALPLTWHMDRYMHVGRLVWLATTPGPLVERGAASWRTVRQSEHLSAYLSAYFHQAHGFIRFGDSVGFHKRYVEALSCIARVPPHQRVLHAEQLPPLPPRESRCVRRAGPLRRCRERRFTFLEGLTWRPRRIDRFLSLPPE